MAQRWLDQEPFMSLIEDCWYAKNSAERVAACQAVKTFIRATLAGRPRTVQYGHVTVAPRRRNRQVPEPVPTPAITLGTVPPWGDPAAAIPVRTRTRQEIESLYGMNTTFVYDPSPEVSGYAATLLAAQPDFASSHEEHQRYHEVYQRWIDVHLGAPAQPLEPLEPQDSFDRFANMIDQITPRGIPVNLTMTPMLSYDDITAGVGGPDPLAPTDPPVLHSAHNGDPDTTNHD